ncbi:sensor histidine kinase [Sphingomonas sp. 37zxx]|uniref:sensor histidine kinase n=1 Tax=Sphingomonas sp. 37zxx TaxID=1550073 RepID=UPI00068F84D7|nr:HAMP domain-containing sensor histidine kinase [Sphingomonas sp. 37zxx]
MTAPTILRADDRGAPIGFRRLMLLTALALALLVTVLVIGLVTAHQRTGRLQALGDTAWQQALLVTRIEADLTAMLLVAPDDRAVPRAQVLARLEAYEALIAAERMLLDGDAAALTAQDAEQAAAQRLAALVRATPPRIAQARALVKAIAADERAEAEQAVAQSIALRIEGARRAAIVMGLALALLGGVVLALWRQVIRPIGDLADATRRLAAEASPVRVPVRGLAELRDLAVRFNDMATMIERQVAERTESIEASNEALREIDARRRLFFAKVGHELRTPVTVMRGEAEVALRHGVNVASLRDALAQVRDNADFLDRRIEDLLGIARAENGALVLQHEPIDLAALVSESGAVAEAFARANGIVLSVGAPGPVPVHGDRQWLRQAMLTVIDNAVKFSPPRGRVTLTLAAADGLARISVVDEGPGVAAEALDDIFAPYRQAVAGRQRGGAGLGLSLARWIAHQHKGSIIATPARAGQGLCVEMTLPVLQ